jgi:DNA replication protein DnaC
MLVSPTLEKLRTLRLTGMADAMQELLEKPPGDMDFEAQLAIIVDRECDRRDSRKLSARLKQSRLPALAAMEDIDYKPERALSRSKMNELSRGQWIRLHHNILITGLTGCGKTWLASALAHRACLDGFTARYIRLPRMWEELKIARANGSWIQWLASLAKIDVLILDDWGLAVPDAGQRNDLLEILDDRYGRRSTVITSQLPVSSWHEYINDDTLADAILDRLLHNANRIELKGESLRKKQPEKLQTENT